MAAFPAVRWLIARAVSTQSSISTKPKPFHHILLIISAVELEVYFKEEGMATKIFVNLPVKDLKRAIEYFSQLGYQFNPPFTDKRRMYDRQR